MKISTNIVANCSDFVWSLNITSIEDIRKALKNIEEAVGWKVYGKMWLGDTTLFFPVDIDEVEKIDYKEEGDTYQDIGVDLVKILHKNDPTITRGNYKESQSYKNIMGNNKIPDLIGKKPYMNICIADINHLPNESGFFELRGYGIPELGVGYKDGYTDNTFVIRDDQPGENQLKVLGNIMKKLGGTFYHTDGGYGQAEDHRAWFEENGYGDILGLEEE